MNCDAQVNNDESSATKHEIDEDEDEIIEGENKLRGECLKKIHRAEVSSENKEESEIDFSNEFDDFSASTSRKFKK